MKKLMRMVAVGSVALLLGCATKSTVNDTQPGSPVTLSDDQLVEEIPPVKPSRHSPAVSDSNDLWQRLRAGFALDLELDNDRIRIQREWYARHPEYFTQVTRRAERYLHYIIEQAEAREMPLELTLLPIVESAFDPFAYSHGRAAGPWQFIPSTGDHFGMERTWWADQRRDILQSTHAALDYLQQLANRFDGDWHLALASYNAGGGTVSRAIRRNSEAGKATDYWHLRLPRETTDYVPKLLAIAQIVADPQAHGVTLHPIANEPYFQVVDTGGQLDLSRAAEMADISMEELYLLNPSLNRWATAPDGPHRLLLPVDSAAKFTQQLASLSDDERMQWRQYTIQRGDNLGSIARRHNTTTQALRSINNLNSNTIIAGRTLLIPSNNGQDSSVADKPKQQKQRINYTVSAGDSLWGIARHHKVTVQQLLEWNELGSNTTLRPGQTLKIWSEDSQVSESASPASPNMIRRVHYAVRRGDSLYGIANRFNVSINDIRSWNNNLASNRHLTPGQRLNLYVDIRQTH